MGESKLMTFRLTAPAAEKPLPCSIQRVKTHFQVELEDLEFTVAPNDEIFVPVRWTPAQGGAASGSLLTIKWGLNGVVLGVAGTALEVASTKKKVNYKGAKKPLVVRRGGNRLRAKAPAASKVEERCKATLFTTTTRLAFFRQSGAPALRLLHPLRPH